ALQFNATPPGFLYDAFPVHVLTTDSLQFLGNACGLDADARRFRPNILLEMISPSCATTEQGWVGAALKIGGVVLHVDSPTSRCSMPGRAQPGFDLREEKGLPRAMAEHVNRNLGVNVRVVEPGAVKVGDTVQLLQP
ncbi:MAG: MOSC domain-containing protein, partial [Haliea sp.]